MQQSNSFKHFFVRNSYLLVAAAWLVTISFIIDNYLTVNASAKTVAKNISTYIARQENDFDAVTTDTALLKKLANKTYSEKDVQELAAKKYFLYLYSKNAMDRYHLLFWSTQVVEPVGSVSIMNGKSGFIQLANGYYVWRKTNLDNLVAIALIPVKWNYSITNDYLKNSFNTGDKIESTYILTEEERTNAIKSKDGNFLFSIEPKIVSTVTDYNLLAAILQLIAPLFVLIFVEMRRRLMIPILDIYKS